MSPVSGVHRLRAGAQHPQGQELLLSLNLPQTEVQAQSLIQKPSSAQPQGQCCLIAFMKSFYARHSAYVITCHRHSSPVGGAHLGVEVELREPRGVFESLVTDSHMTP